MKLKMLSKNSKKGLMRTMIDSKVLKVMNLAIKYIGELTEEELDNLIEGSIGFSTISKEKRVRKSKTIQEVKDNIDWSIEVGKIKNSKSREEASEYLRKLKLTNEKLRNLGKALGISIAKATKKDKIIAMIIDAGVGSKLKVEGIRKGIIGE